MKYIDRLTGNLTHHNKQALLYGDGTAWDNKKKKTLRLQSPNGNVWRNIIEMDAKKNIEDLRNIMDFALKEGIEI